LKCNRECRALTFPSLMPLHENINKIPTEYLFISVNLEEVEKKKIMTKHLFCI